MNTKALYENAEIKIIEISNSDILTISGGGDDGGNGKTQSRDFDLIEMEGEE